MDAASRDPQPAGSPAPSRRALRSGAGVSALGGLGAVVGFFLPWFVFLVAVQTGCHAQFVQVQIYKIYGATVAIGTFGSFLIAPALMTLVFGVTIIILAALSLRRPGLIRIRILLALSLIGLVMLGVVGVAMVKDPVKPSGSFIYLKFLGFAPGFWVTAAGLALALIGGATLHPAARARPPRQPIGEIALAALGVVALLSSTAAAITLRQAPYPTLTCAQGENAPRTGGSLAYFTTPDDVFALDAASGQVSWRCQNPLGGVVTDTAPALAAGVLYVAARDGYVYAIRADTAKILWHTDVGGRWVNTTMRPHIAPIVGDGLLFGVNGAGRAYALRVSDGARAWASDIAPPVAWTPPTLLLADGALLFPAYTHSGLAMMALDERTGHILWQSPDPFVSEPFTVRKVPMQVAQGLLYDEEQSQQTREVYLVARAIADGMTRWRYPLEPAGNNIATPFIVANGAVYFDQRQPNQAGATAQQTPRMVALRGSDGEMLWSAPAPDSLSILQPQPFPPVVPAVELLADSGRVYLAVSSSIAGDAASTVVVSDTVYCFDTRKGAVLWREDLTQQPVRIFNTQAKHTNFALMGDAVYLLDPSISLVAFDALIGAKRWQTSAAQQLGVASSAPGDFALSVAGTASPLLYVATTTFFAINPADGSVRWQRAPGHPSTPYYPAFDSFTPLISPPTFSG